MNFAMPSMTPVVKWLLVVNIGVFLVHDIFLAGSRSVGGGDLHTLVLDVFAIGPAQWKGWFPLVPVWQLVTYGFLHAGLSHILMNMLLLYFLGTMLEGVVGSRRFLVFYLATVVVAGFAQLSLGLITAGGGHILGASGGVLGVVCATATLRPTTRVIFILFPITLKTLALIYVAADVYRLIWEIKGASSGVASLAHLTGAALGFVAVRKGWIWRDPVAKIEEVRERRAEQTAVDDQRRLDELLDRIHREGIGSLSPREKAFLKRMSKSR